MRTNMKTTDIDKKKQDEKKPRGDLRREKKIYLEKDNPRQNLSFILMIVSFILFIYSTYGIKRLSIRMLSLFFLWLLPA